MATMMSSCSQTKLGLEFTFHQAFETLHRYIKQVSTAPNLTWHSSQTSPSPHRGSADSKSSNLNFVCWVDILQVCDLKRSCFVATGQLKMFSLALFIVPKIAPLLTWRHNRSLVIMTEIVNWPALYTGHHCLWCMPAAGEYCLCD